MKNEAYFNAIKTNIHALAELLEETMLRVTEAGDAIDKGEQNQAIGAMLDIEHQLDTALALYRTTIALHRKGGAR